MTARIANIENAEYRMRSATYVRAYSDMAAYIRDKIEVELEGFDNDEIIRDVLGIDTNEVTAQAAINGFRDMLWDLDAMANPFNVSSIRI